MEKRTVSKTVRIPVNVLNSLEKIRKEHDITLSVLINKALFNYVKIIEGEKSVDIINEHIIVAIEATIESKLNRIKHIDNTMNAIFELLSSELDLSYEQQEKYKLIAKGLLKKNDL